MGGWSNIEDMGMSIGVIWDTTDQKFHIYIEHQIKEMVDHFYQADKIVGFNHVGFDFRKDASRSAGTFSVVLDKKSHSIIVLDNVSFERPMFVCANSQF